MVHSVGGTLLQHLKEHRLHGDLRPGDRFFYFTTCGWMMWNWLVSGLASGATLLLYDGHPLAPPTVLWDYAAAEGCTTLGASARWLAACQQEGLAPGADPRPVGPAGDPLDRLAPGAGVLRLGLPGGQDATCGSAASPAARTSSPASPWAARCCRCGGASCSAGAWAWPWTSSTRTAGRWSGGKGELVCTAPFPSMPTGFWRDPDGERYRAAYFARFAGRLVPRRLRRAHPGRRHGHPRPLRHGAQPGRRAHRHRRDLPHRRRGIRRWSRAWWWGSSGATTCGCCCSWCCGRGRSWTRRWRRSCGRACAGRPRRGTCRR